MVFQGGDEHGGGYINKETGELEDDIPYLARNYVRLVKVFHRVSPENATKTVINGFAPKGILEMLHTQLDHESSEYKELTETLKELYNYEYQISTLSSD